MFVYDQRTHLRQIEYIWERKQLCFVSKDFANQRRNDG